MRRKNWRPEVYNLNLLNKEDKALLEICKSQNYNWRRISKQMISIGYKRSGKSCKERFHNQLNPFVNKDQWTQNEVDKLFELQSKYGNRWRIIAKELPQRTDGLIKNYFYSLVRKVLRRLSKTVNGTKNGSQMTKTLKPSVISQIFCVNQNQVNYAGIEVEFAQLFRNIILKYKNFNLSQQIDIEDIDKIKSIFQTLQQLNESYNDDLEKKNISKSRSKSQKLKTKLSNIDIDHLILQKIQLKHPIFTMKSCPLPKLYSKFVFHHNTYHPTQLMYQSISSFTSQNIDQNNSYGAILVKPEQLLFFQPHPSPYYVFLYTIQQTMNISAFIQQQSSMHTYYSSYFNPTPEIKEEHEI
ncbi:unnamed protein product (macronuclear) [Paramecium tetraurelia]|uniref:Uncharacterized protein n=1 Tax=Paramecium tetraurelia TaxID=5888 RepID=A0BQR6_PARTE|nr:uncharacterized protein GSPATT00031112001 [Paramecium tetraurelia]CAK60883.1 unnamed protein product [Paramecium tetraurelia]|eukprot:XP_001428281.1 hypothetical protein (macronuclear) [Paramecium tetraurelia strain d4-2]